MQSALLLLKENPLRHPPSGQEMPLATQEGKRVKNIVCAQCAWSKSKTEHRQLHLDMYWSVLPLLPTSEDIWDPSKETFDTQELFHVHRKPLPIWLFSYNMKDTGGENLSEQQGTDTGKVQLEYVVDSPSLENWEWLNKPLSGVQLILLRA